MTDNHRLSANTFARVLHTLSKEVHSIAYCWLSSGFGITAAPMHHQLRRSHQYSAMPHQVAPSAYSEPSPTIQHGREWVRPQT
eukprot:1903859-Amphidinium_carterae.1